MTFPDTHLAVSCLAKPSLLHRMKTLILLNTHFVKIISQTMWLLILQPWNDFFKSRDCPSSPLWWQFPPPLSRSSYNNQDATLAEPLLLGVLLNLAMVRSAGHHFPDSYVSLVFWIFSPQHHTSVYKLSLPPVLPTPFPRLPMWFLLSVAFEVNWYKKNMHDTPVYP